MTTTPSKTIDLVYFNAGGGHRAAAHALDAVIALQQRPWTVRRVDLVQVLDPQSRFRRVTGFAPEDVYNRRLARGWTLGLAQELKLLQGAIRLGHATLVERLRRHWGHTRPDLVVSLVPNFNRAMHDALAEACPGAPFVTVLTDLADHPPDFWIEPGCERQHLVCGSARAVEQALAAGCAPARIHRSSGMVIRPDFYRPLALDRRAERLRAGLDPDAPTGVVLFGGHGSAAMLDVARALADVQLVLMCGHNAALARRLRRQAAAAPRAVVEFTPDVRRWLNVGDFFVGKPGPGSLSEAVQQGLPVVTVRNAWTMPQERYNTDWIREHGLGRVGNSMRRIRPVVLDLLSRLDEYRANVARIDNRAVFEVPAILAALLAAAEPSEPPLQTAAPARSPAAPRALAC